MQRSATRSVSEPCDLLSPRLSMFLQCLQTWDLTALAPVAPLLSPEEQLELALA